jgi:hypothetical protein
LRPLRLTSPDPFTRVRPQEDMEIIKLLPSERLNKVLADGELHSMLRQQSEGSAALRAPRVMQEDSFYRSNHAQIIAQSGTLLDPRTPDATMMA